MAELTFLNLQPAGGAKELHLLLLYDVGGSHRNMTDLSAWLAEQKLTYKLHVIVLVGLLSPREDTPGPLSGPSRTPHPAILEGDASYLLAAAENIVDSVVYACGKHDHKDVSARLTPHSVNASAGAAYILPDLLLKVAAVSELQSQGRTTWQRHLAQRFNIAPSAERDIAVLEVDTGEQETSSSPLRRPCQRMVPDNAYTVLRVRGCLTGGDRIENRGEDAFDAVGSGENLVSITPKKFLNSHFYIIKLCKQNNSSARWKVQDVNEYELPLP